MGGRIAGKGTRCQLPPPWLPRGLHTLPYLPLPHPTACLQLTSRVPQRGKRGLSCPWSRSVAPASWILISYQSGRDRKQGLGGGAWTPAQDWEASEASQGQDAWVPGPCPHAVPGGEARWGRQEGRVGGWGWRRSFQKVFIPRDIPVNRPCYLRGTVRPREVRPGGSLWFKVP